MNNKNYRQSKQSNRNSNSGGNNRNKKRAHFAGKKNRSPQESRQDGESQRNRNKPAHKRHHNHRRSSSHTHYMKRYDQLLEQHFSARKKYFELFYRANPRQLEKLAKQFNHTIEMLRRFEANLKPWQLEQLKKRFVDYPYDHDYSSNHQLEPDIQNTFNIEAPEFGPHFLNSQIEKPDYSIDTEESTGSIEDYQRYRASKQLSR